MKIQLPFFRGFLEYYIFRLDRLHDEFISSEEFLEEKYGRPVNEEEVEFDDSRYTQDICHKFIQEFISRFEEIYPGFIENMSFDELVSPTYYQCNTDKLFVDAVFCADWRQIMLSFMQANSDWLSDKIAADWTSRSGFNSYMSNEYEVWFDEMQHNDADPRIVGVMLGYMAEIADSEFQSEVDSVFSSISLSDYLMIRTEK